MSERAMVREAFANLRTQADTAGVPVDVLGRLVLDEVIGLWRESRSLDDIANELRFVAENVDEDTDFAFMRP